MDTSISLSSMTQSLPPGPCLNVKTDCKIVIRLLRNIEEDRLDLAQPELTLRSVVSTVVTNVLARNIQEEMDHALVTTQRIKIHMLWREMRTVGLFACLYASQSTVTWEQNPPFFSSND
jgi:hypothetical protein